LFDLAVISIHIAVKSKIIFGQKCVGLRMKVLAFFGLVTFSRVGFYLLMLALTYIVLNCLPQAYVQVLPRHRCKPILGRSAISSLKSKASAAPTPSS
ncbi:hypothetical protein, partial [Shewanella algidipiscicola]|uniref:hypothetical protein n=1 Tax=Shewanella algidipiscicola TaxID=614070 RepID=UPI001C7DC23E